VYEPARIGNYQNEIERLLGIEINFSIVITRENLVSIVDLLEGVEIFIPTRVFHRDDDNIILFPSGMTVLDGDKAGLYAAYSLPHEDAEMEVFRRQRFFLGLLNRKNQMNYRFENRELARLYFSFFRTSMSQRTLRYLYNELVNIDTSRINIQSVGGNLREVSGQMLVIPHWDGNLIREIVRQTLGTLTRDIGDYSIERTLTVEVLNGTAVNGLAGRTAEMLRSFGYDVISIGNAEFNNHESTVIIHRSGDERTVRAFGDLIRSTNIHREAVSLDELEDLMINQNIELRADVTLLLGRNFNGRYVTEN
jgi:hypothetical protein